MIKRSDSRCLTTTTDVVKALGGIRPVSVLTGSTYKATENWSRAKTFPSRYFLVMTHALEKRRLAAPPELWGMVTPEQRKQALQDLIAAQKQRAAA